MARNGAHLSMVSLRRPKKTTLIFLFLLIAFSFIAYQRTHKLRVFVIQSYHSNMSWVKGLHAGMDQVFKKKRYIDIRQFYMNTKHKHSNAYLKRISREAISAIRQYKPDVIIAFDTHAQKWVASKFINSPKYKIVLAGVTESSDLKRFKAAKNITGVLEKIPINAIQEVLALMLPNSKRIYYISDNSITSHQLDKDISQEDWGRFKLVEHTKVKTFQQWKKEVLAAQKKADVILLSTYKTILDGKKHISPTKLIQWSLANSKVPIIGLYESFIDDGGYLAISVASFEQGYTAAKIANFILEKKLTVDKVPFLTSQTFQLQLRKQKVLKHYPNIHITVILEAFSKAKWQLDDLVYKGLPKSQP